MHQAARRMRLTGRTNSVASTRDNTPGQTRARQFRLCAPALSRSKRYALSATTFCIRSPASGKGWRATENNRPISSGVCPTCGHADDLPSLNHLRRCKTSHKRAIPHPLSGALASLTGSFLSGRAGWMKIEKMPCSRERLLPKRARLDALSSKFLPLLSPSGQSPLKGTPRKLCHRSSLAFPALWPVHRRPCRPPPPIEAARTSQSLPSPSGQSPLKGTPQNFATRQPRIPRPLAGTSASLPGAAPYRSGTHLPEPTVPIRTIATQRNTAKLCHKAASHSPPFGRYVGVPAGRCPLSKRHAPPRAYRSHPGNRRPWNAWKIAAKRCPLFSCIPGFWQGLTNLPGVSLNSPAPDGR